MIKITRGNIWNESSAHIVIPVNCLGVMGAGLAKQCIRRHPEILEPYRIACKTYRIRPGHPLMIEKFIMFPTKNHWRNPSQLIWIEEGLRQIPKLIKGIQRLAIPRIGCGLGQLDWESQVKPLCLKLLQGLPTDIVIYG